MRLIGREKLNCLYGAGEQAEKWVLSWVTEVMNAHWKYPADVSAQFPNVRQGNDGRMEFPVGDCKWAISLLIAFPQGIALITALKENDNVYGN